MDYYGKNINLKSVSKTNEVTGRQEIVYEYEGLPTAINSLRQQLLNKQDRPQRIEIEDNPPTQILRAYYNGFEKPSEVIYRWEILESDVEESILVHPLMSLFPTEDREIFRAYMEGRIIRDENEPELGRLDGRVVITYKPATYSANGWETTYYEIDRVGNTQFELQEAAIKIIKSISMGQTSYYRTQTVLRRTTNLQNINDPTFINNYTTQHKYVGSVIAHSVLQEDFDLPTELINILPQPYSSDDYNIDEYFAQGWFVKGMQSTIEADGSWEISQEFIWGYWNKLFYGDTIMIDKKFTLDK